MSVEAKLSRLSLNLKNNQSPKGSSTSLHQLNSQPDVTPESWEEVADDAPVEAPGPSLKQVTSNDGPAPPPPTPISPHNSDPISRNWETGLTDGRSTPRHPASTREGNEKRPEKTTATANRMIAGALGIKAPKKTEEQKQYDKAMREAEIKRKAREKEQREQERLDDEQAKAAVWGE